MEVKELFDLLRKEAECSFCIQPFNKPKTLPCLHSFCLDCLNKYAATRRQQGHTTFDCPECLATFQLPENDKFDAFQTAFYQNRLLDILALEKSGTGQQKNCDNCDENVAASSYCFECQTFLCSVCIDKHNGIKVIRAHRQASLQNLQTADVQAFIQRPELCNKHYHEREPLEYYCEDCQVCICQKCPLVEHKKHSMLEISCAAERRKMQIIQDVEQMKSRVSECKQEIEKSKDNFKVVEQHIEDARHKLQATVQQLIRNLKEREANVMIELDEVHQTQQQAHLAQLKNFELSLAQLNSAIKYAEAITTRNMAPEILQAQTSITQRCGKLLTGQGITAHKAVRVSLVTNDELCQTVHQLALGRVVVSLTEPSRSVSEGKGLQRATCGKRAEFMIITKDAEEQQCYEKRDQVTVQIQTAAQEETEVKIEEKKDGTYHVTYTPQRHGQQEVMINVNGQPLIGSPWNVHVTPHQYLAISTFGSKGFGKGQFDRFRGLSVSSTGNIAVADCFNRRVQVFTAEGEFLREFGQGNLRRPLSVAYTSTDHVIVVDGEIQKALLFSKTGTFLRQFSHGYLDDPRRVSVTNDGRVMVCDVGCAAVIILSPDGKELLMELSMYMGDFQYYSVFHQEKFFVSYTNEHCIRVFDAEGSFLYKFGCQGTGKGELSGPEGLAIDKFGNLLVVDNYNGRLQVFTVDGEFVSEAGYEVHEFIPSDVAVSKDGHVYVTDNNQQRVQIFT